MTTYTDRNFKNKAELKRAVAAGERVTYHQAGLGSEVLDGTVYLSGPHYPKPHSWYAEAKVANGAIVSVK